jgi:MFS family permease
LSARRGHRAPIAALAATTTAGYGVLFYAYGVLLGPMSASLGWSRSFLSGAFSLALVVAAALTIPIGHWLDRHQPRGLFLAGSVAASALVVGWGLAASRPLFVVVWMLLGCCQAVLFYDPAFTVLTKWYDGNDRARAITSVTLLAGLASTVFGPLTALLERSLGWRGAVLVLAAILAAVVIPCFSLGLRAPTRLPLDKAQLLARRDAAPDAGTSTVPAAAFASRGFWLLTVAYLLSTVTTFAVAVHLVSYLHGRGLGTGAAATVLGAVGLMQVLGRGTFIRLSAYRPSVELATWVLGAKAAGLALVVVVLPGAVGLVPFVIVYGAANGVATLTRATTLAELYGPRHYGSISAVVASVSAFGGAVAPFAAAVAIDLVGGIGPVFAGLVVLSGLAALVNALVARPNRRMLPASSGIDPATAGTEP